MILHPSSSSDDCLQLVKSHQDSTERKAQNDKLKRRRTKKDSQAQREFVCPCGKSYLSYPALYTHTKQKHNGVAPKRNSQTNSDESMSQESTSQSWTQDTLVSLVNLLGVEAPTQPASASDAGDLIQWEIQLELIEAKNNDKRLIVSNYYNDLFRGLETVESQDEKKKKGTMPSNTTCNAAFIYFIIEMQQHLNFDQLKHIYLFVFVFRRMINDTNTDKVVEECDVIQASQLVEKANGFIGTTLQKTMEEIVNHLSDRNWIVQLVQQPNLKDKMVQIMLHFCNWLYARHLTDDKLVLRADMDQ